MKLYKLIGCVMWAVGCTMIVVALPSCEDHYSISYIMHSVAVGGVIIVGTGVLVVHLGHLGFWERGSK